MYQTIILVDDEEQILDIEKEALAEIGLNAESFTNPNLAWQRIQRGDVALVVSDWNMPEMTGMELLFKTRALQRTPYVIIVTAHGTIPRAVQAMNQGAFSFFEKPFDIHAYQKLVKDSLAHFQRSTPPVLDAVQAKQTPVTSHAGHAGDPIAQSALMKQALKIAHSAAGTDSSVLLLGESGSGKEMVADYIHRHSRRSGKPLIKVNCGALPEHLMESELFGHEKGAFTGAIRRNIGRFEMASGGTLFLDEIGDLLPSLQVKLLRALQERTIERIGSSTPIAVDFRLICATHRDLKKAIVEGRFREDLFYRVNIVPLRIPALRERPDDVEPLSRHFFEHLRKGLAKGPSGFSDGAMTALKNYTWPGNVRQLRNAIEYALVLCKDELIGAGDLPEDVRANSADPARTVTEPEVNGSDAAENPVVRQGLKGSVQEAEAASILAAINRHHWRMTDVARELNISRSTLYQRLELYQIKRPE